MLVGPAAGFRLFIVDHLSIYTQRLVYSALSINVNREFAFLIGVRLSLNLSNVRQEREKS